MYTGICEKYLSTLPSVQFYRGVQKNYQDLSNYIQSCEKIKVEEKSDDVKTICKKFLRYLETSNIWIVAEPGYDVCLLLNYWIYDNLNKIYGAKYDSDIAFANFQYIWSYPNQYITKNTSCKQKCKYEIDVHKDEDWKKRKEFYEYCVDYYTIKGMITTYTEKCNDFYEYIKKKEELYKYFDHLCSSKPTECPKFYQDCKIYNPDILLSQLHCRDEMDKNQVTAKSSAEHSGSQATDTAPESSEIGTKVGQSVLGIAPVVLTGTALYRLGGYNSNSVSDMDEFSSYTQELEDMFSNSSGNYISYKPI
ncbi:PIR Superfamily Protein [Plasmodium ovale curtisi]|uniref:PIR Superfamily Protein n=1 Tax=Plasmodium ovale curtisi TaxID=864141 RepID=A0A1A8X3B6_PLAOA|nr:PIR Superfamily Protein [Plasmodium ovale curtisi]